MLPSLPYPAPIRFYSPRKRRPDPRIPALPLRAGVGGAPAFCLKWPLAVAGLSDLHFDLERGGVYLFRYRVTEAGGDCLTISATKGAACLLAWAVVWAVARLLVSGRLAGCCHFPQPNFSQGNFWNLAGRSAQTLSFLLATAFSCAPFEKRSFLAARRLLLPRSTSVAALLFLRFSVPRCSGSPPLVSKTDDALGHAPPPPALRAAFPPQSCLRAFRPRASNPCLTLAHFQLALPLHFLSASLKWRGSILCPSHLFSAPSSSPTPAKKLTDPYPAASLVATAPRPSPLPNFHPPNIRASDPAGVGYFWRVHPWSSAFPVCFRRRQRPLSSDFERRH